MSQKITPNFNIDAAGNTKSIQFDGGDPVYNGVSGGVVMPAATETEIAQFILNGQSWVLSMNIANGGANPFTSCRIQMQAHPNSNFEDYVTSAQLNTGTGIQNVLLQESGNPTTLAAGADVNVAIQCNAPHAVRVMATSTLGAKGTVRASAQSF